VNCIPPLTMEQEIGGHLGVGGNDKSWEERGCMKGKREWLMRQVLVEKGVSFGHC